MLSKHFAENFAMSKEYTYQTRISVINELCDMLDTSISITVNILIIYFSLLSILTIYEQLFTEKESSRSFVICMYGLQ